MYALVPPLAGGALIGWVYFRSLWSAVRQLPHRARPGAWMAGMLLLRLALAGAVFALIARAAGWPALIAALAGFTLMRSICVRPARVAQPRGSSQ